MKRIALHAVASLLSGCTAAMVLSNNGDLVVLDWDSVAVSREEMVQAAVASCREVGKLHAEEVANVSATPTAPSWSPHKQRRVTFRCQ